MPQANTSPVQLMKIAFPAGAWKRGLEKSPSAKFHVSSLRHAIIIPGGKGYPHLTIDAEALYFSKDRKQIFIEFRQAHYSQSPNGLRVAFYDNGRGLMTAENYDSDLMPDILREISSWIKTVGLPLTFADINERSYEQITKSKDFFEPAETISPTKKSTKAKQPRKEQPALESIAKLKLEESETQAEPEALAKETDAAEISDTKTAEGGQSPAKKKKKKKKKTAAAAAGPDDWEAMMKEVEEATSKAKEGAAKPSASKKKKGRKSQISGAAKPEAVKKDPKEAYKPDDKSIINKEWEDLLGIPDFDLITEHADASMLSPIERSVLHNFYNVFMVGNQELTDKQMARITKKVLSIKDKLESTLRYVQQAFRGKDENKERRRAALLQRLEEIETVSETLVLSALHQLRFTDILPDSLKPQVKDYHAVFLQAFALFFSSMGLVFLFLRSLEYYSMATAYIVHLKNKIHFFGSSLYIAMDRLSYFHVALEHTLGQKAKSLIHYQLPPHMTVRDLIKSQKDAFPILESHIEIQHDLLETFQSITSLSLTFETAEWRRVSDIIGAEAQNIEQIANPKTILPKERQAPFLCFLELLYEAVQHVASEKAP
ncbi:MAG: hypothetical protein MI784_02265 [Cytophagales bacterium]|nr:hypothetical protein [Cytophagales bacterium]